jgi:uncharacterized membrane protein YcaP (DUF421 family)
MQAEELLWTALRGLAVYALMLVVIRLLGKRTVGNFTAFDLIVALMLGEVVDEMIYGDVSFLQGAVAIVIVAAAKYATAWLSYRSDRLNRVLEGVPTPIVRNGKLVPKGLRSELMNELEAFAALRLHEISDIREVKLALMEADGEVSVLKEDWSETLQKGDLESKRKSRKKEEEEEEESPERFRTDSPRALGQDR